METMQTGIRNWTRWVEFLALVTAPFVILVALVVLLVNGSGGSSPAAATAAQRAGSATPAETVDLTVVTDAQTGHPGYIAFVPANVTLPAHSTVRIRIANFDGATPQKPAQYARVWGTVGGTVTVQPFRAADPNALGHARVVGSLPAGTGVSHTFTVPGMHLNVPVAPMGVTTFVVHTGKPGHYAWRCFNPCGSGATGWAGPMSQRGYMSGVITVA
jgi:heme/copper-type cytochrome/quinol oxidase subunit 2